MLTRTCLASYPIIMPCLAYSNGWYYCYTLSTLPLTSKYKTRVHYNNT